MKRPILSLIILLACCSFNLAQSSSSLHPGDNKKKLSFGIKGSIDYCNRWLTDIDKTEFSENYIRLFNDLEIGKPGYTIGVSLVIPLSRKSILNTGLLLANQGYQTKWRDAQWPDPSLPPSSFKSIYTFYSLDIPLVINTFLDPSISKWFLHYGFTGNIFLQQNETFIFKENGQKDKSTHKANEDYKPINLSTEIGFGRQFSLSPTMNLQIAPVFRYGIFSIIDAPVGNHLWSIGLNIVCYWQRSSSNALE